VTHPCLVPSLELDIHNSCEIQNTSCSDTAVRFGVRTVTSTGKVDTTIALFLEIWESAKVGRHTIRNLIGSFIEPGSARFDPPLDFDSNGGHYGRMEWSKLPNISAGEVGHNFCHSLLVLETNSRASLLLIFFRYMFSGLLAPPADAPAGVAWLFALI